MDIAADLAMEAKLHTQHAGNQAVTGFKDFGSEFIKQLFGFGKGQQSVSDDQLSQLKTDDKAFSDAAYAQTRAQVMSIYETHRQKRMKEEEDRRQREKLEAEKRMQRIRGETLAGSQRNQVDVQTAMSKASAETGKTYGAE